MSNFDPNAILRGAQLTVVGGKLLSIRCRVLSLTWTSLPSIAESQSLHT